MVVGHSGGGWGAMALAGRNPGGVRALINFSGGHGSQRGSPNGNCGPAPIVKGAGTLGKTARKPMLWLYVQNDFYIGPQLARQMHQAFEKSGGRARLDILPAYENEGHYLFEDDGVPIWGPIIAKWLESSASR